MGEIQILQAKFSDGAACPKCARRFDRNCVRETSAGAEIVCLGCHHVFADIEADHDGGEEWD